MLQTQCDMRKRRGPAPPEPSANWASARARDRNIRRTCRRVRSIRASWASLRLGCELLQDRLPLLLLTLDESGELGGGHRTRIAAAPCELLLDLRIGDHRVQGVAHLAHDCLG